MISLHDTVIYSNNNSNRKLYSRIMSVSPVQYPISFKLNDLVVPVYKLCPHIVTDTNGSVVHRYNDYINRFYLVEVEVGGYYGHIEIERKMDVSFYREMYR